MVSINVDSEVFGILKSQAEPFVDTPNDVLRRILGLSAGENGRTRQEHIGREERSEPKSNARTSTETFLRQVLESVFGGRFHVRSPYRTMFESPEAVVYFQNFNSPGTSNLWYRLRKTALENLLASKQKALVAFSNPAERMVYIIPVEEIGRRAAKAGWDRTDLEVNIDPVNHRWRELDWDLTRYLKRIGPEVA